MYGRYLRHRATWVLGLALAALVGGVFGGLAGRAWAQGPARQQRFITLRGEYERLRDGPQQPADQQQKAEDNLASRLLLFAEAAPGEDLSFQALTFLFGLKLAAPEPRAAGWVVEHHLK